MIFYDPRLNVAMRPFDFKRGIDNLSPELRGEMEVTIYAPRTRQRGESCCVTDAEGRHWCFKVIRNIKLNGHAKCFVLWRDVHREGDYTSKDLFHIDGKHICGSTTKGSTGSKVSQILIYIIVFIASCSRGIIAPRMTRGSSVICMGTWQK